MVRVNDCDYLKKGLNDQNSGGAKEFDAENVDIFFDLLILIRSSRSVKYGNVNLIIKQLLSFVIMKFLSFQALSL